MLFKEKIAGQKDISELTGKANAFTGFFVFKRIINT